MSDFWWACDLVWASNWEVRRSLIPIKVILVSFLMFWVVLNKVLLVANSGRNYSVFQSFFSYHILSFITLIWAWFNVLETSESPLDFLCFELGWILLLSLSIKAGHFRAHSNAMFYSVMTKWILKSIINSAHNQIKWF